MPDLLLTFDRKASAIQQQQQRLQPFPRCHFTRLRSRRYRQEYSNQLAAASGALNTGFTGCSKLVANFEICTCWGWFVCRKLGSAAHRQLVVLTDVDVLSKPYLWHAWAFADLHVGPPWLCSTADNLSTGQPSQRQHQRCQSRLSRLQQGF